MGYTHNWSVDAPPADWPAVIRAIGLDLLARLPQIFKVEFTHDADGTVLLCHRSGQAESLVIGPGGRLDGSCKAGRGVAELDIVQVLWRVLFAINGAGGTMRLRGDWIHQHRICGDLGLDTDASLALAVLLHECADLTQGRTLKVTQIPRAWPEPREAFHSDGAATRLMLYRNDESGSPSDALVFGIGSDGTPDYTEVHDQNSRRFARLVERHVLANSMYPALRGFRFADCVAWLDGEVIVGGSEELRYADHPESLARQTDLLPLVPGPQWLDEEKERRRREARA